MKSLHKHTNNTAYKFTCSLSTLFTVLKSGRSVEEWHTFNKSSSCFCAFPTWIISAINAQIFQIVNIHLIRIKTRVFTRNKGFIF